MVVVCATKTKEAQTWQRNGQTVKATSASARMGAGKGDTQPDKNLHPRYTSDAGKRSRKDGQFHGAGHVNKQRAVERIPSISSPPLSEHSKLLPKSRTK